MSAGTRWFYKERQKEKHDFNITSCTPPPLSFALLFAAKQDFKLFMCHIANSQSVKIISPPANHPVVASTGP